ncbi:MAG: hypothetical protein GY926_14755 [bacterium]|nr:hypothetical protein [Actinomycetes bacterium]MCP3911624.1 hypothetical protein [Actinomycetes bacterium]MCP4086840.1 hypothetical protein [Actinomycetes bacterium]MCP4966477.1 hypothetical protein [bacterium]
MFHTIQPTPGLSPSSRRRANRNGPPATAVRTSYQSLLTTAGFVDVEARNETVEYRATQLRWIAAGERHEAALRAAIGDEAYEQGRRESEAALRAIEDGLLVRYRYSATR